MCNKPKEIVVIGSITAKNLGDKQLMAIKKTDSVFVVLPYPGRGITSSAQQGASFDIESTHFTTYFNYRTALFIKGLDFIDKYYTTVPYNNRNLLQNKIS